MSNLFYDQLERGYHGIPEGFIPLSVIEEIKTEIENSSCGSWYVENPDKTLEKVVLLRMVDVLGIIDKKVKEHTK